jgi:hypothetical protein
MNPVVSSSERSPRSDRLLNDRLGLRDRAKESGPFRFNRSGMSQDSCCAAVRRFLSERVGERLSIDERPDRSDRNARAVEEVWRSASHGYVVEHTRIEAFEAQIRDDMAFQRLVVPLEQQFAGAVPGRFAAAIPFGVASSAGIGFSEARAEIARLIATRVGDICDGETAVLRSDRLPYEVRLHKRHSNDSTIFFARWLEEERPGSLQESKPL